MKFVSQSRIPKEFGSEQEKTVLGHGRVTLRLAGIAFCVCLVVFVGILLWETTIKELQPFEREPAAGVGALREALAPTGWDEPDGMFAREYAASDQFNLLLLGNTEGNLTDAMMLLSLDPETRSVAILSIPRDTFYDVPGIAAPGKKIHANYMLGGPNQAEVAVHETLLGIPVHAYVVLDYAGVAAIVDAIGGVPMLIAQDMDQDEEEQGYHIHLKAGEQVLDGAQAVSFLRFRRDYADADMGRQREQQTFMMALFDRISSPMRMLRAMQAASGHVDSDLTVGDVVFLAKALREPSEIQTASIPGEMKHLDEENVFLYYINEAGTEALLRNVYEGGT
jgi:LCP family protein required for cell wall assembly